MTTSKDNDMYDILTIDWLINTFHRYFLIFATCGVLGPPLLGYHHNAKSIRWLTFLITCHAIFWIVRITDNWLTWTRNVDLTDGKEIAVVTGGSQGLGFEIVKLLVDRGVRVAILDIVPPTKESLLYRGMKYYKTDVTNDAEVAQARLNIMKEVVMTISNTE